MMTGHTESNRAASALGARGRIVREMTLTVTSDLSNVNQVERLLLDFAVQCGCCEDECTQIELAVQIGRAHV